MGTKAPSSLQKTTCQRTNSFNETLKYLHVSTSIPYDIIRIHYFHCSTRGFFSPLQELFSNIALAAGTQDSSPVLDCWSWDYSQKETPVPVSQKTNPRSLSWRVPLSILFKPLILATSFHKDTMSCHLQYYAKCCQYLARRPTLQATESSKQLTIRRCLP
jgi:hypothetical protein